MEIYSPWSDILEGEPSGLIEIARDIEQHSPLPPHTTGSDALGAVMCSVLRRLADADAERLVAMLPPDLQPAARTCPSHPFAEGADQADVIELVAEHLGLDSAGAERTVAVVLEAVLERLPLDAAARLAQMLPDEVRHPKA